jgi:hypothetical protein
MLIPFKDFGDSTDRDLLKYQKANTIEEITVIDIATLTAFITPFLPYLTQLGKKATDKAVESAAGKFGEAGWKKAQDIWLKLSPKVETKPAALEAVTDVLKSPEDADYQTALKVQLKKLIDAEPELADTIAQILAAGSDGISGAQIVQNVVGNYNQSIGQNYGNAIGNVQGDVKF